MDEKADIGVIGLGAMGSNLALRLASKGVAVVGYEPLPAAGPQAGGPASLWRAPDLQSLIARLSLPRLVLLMIPAGAPVDGMIERLLALLGDGDCVMDGGNSHYADTARRATRFRTRGLEFLGLGISGGVEGARTGASIMAGGHASAYARAEPLLRHISARVGGRPCCAYLGEGGAGHFVKMVHNGIEYADMQALGEASELLGRRLGLSEKEAAAVMRAWGDGPLGSYLLDITADILERDDEETGAPLIRRIADSARHKGTGGWFAATALELDVPVPVVYAAIAARHLSGRRVEREAAAHRYATPVPPAGKRASALVPLVADALIVARIFAYGEGFSLLAAARGRWGWDMAPALVARIWQGGCILRAKLLGPVARALESASGRENLLLDSGLGATLAGAVPGLRRVVADAAAVGLPVPLLSSALGSYDSYRAGRLGTAMVQAQRDYFGRHGFERTDRPGIHHIFGNGE